MHKLQQAFPFPTRLSLRRFMPEYQLYATRPERSPRASRCQRASLTAGRRPRPILSACVWPHNSSRRTARRASPNRGPPKLCLTQPCSTLPCFIQTHQTDARYAVLSHEGDAVSGHYVAYVKPRGTEQWYEFDDTRVSAVREEVAVRQQYGGRHARGGGAFGIGNKPNAYVPICSSTSFIS